VKALRRAALIFLGVALAAAASLAAIIAHPQPLFGFHAENGPLELWSDRPFDEAAGRRVLTGVQKRIDASELARPGEHHSIFIVNEPWKERLLFLWSFGAGGLNYFPLTRNVFIRAADVGRGVVLGPSGQPVAGQRTLAYFAAHEIAHTLTAEAIGVWAYARLPTWVREGVADYIGLMGDVDIARLSRLLKVEDRELDPKKSGLYARYRLLVAHLVKEKHWSMMRVLTESPEQKSVEAELLRKE